MNEQKIKKTKKYVGIIMGILVLLFFMMPICYIREIEVTNNQYYSVEEIIQAAAIEQGHLLDFSYLAAEENIMSLPYIAKVEIEYKFPGKIKINLVEKAPFAYVTFKGTYLCLNEQGQVIEQSQKKHHNLPVIDGLKFEFFKNAETLPILNQDNWLTAVQVIQELENYDYVDKINEIDVHNIEEIHLYVDKLDVIMGDIGDFDKKIEVLIQVYEVNGYSMGELTMTPSLSASGKEYLCTLKPIT